MDGAKTMVGVAGSLEKLPGSPVHAAFTRAKRRPARSSQWNEVSFEGFFEGPRRYRGPLDCA
jgi:hypothetical protein